MFANSGGNNVLSYFYYYENNISTLQAMIFKKNQHFKINTINHYQIIFLYITFGQINMAYVRYHNHYHIFEHENSSIIRKLLRLYNTK